MEAETDSHPKFVERIPGPEPKNQGVTKTYSAPVYESEVGKMTPPTFDIYLYLLPNRSTSQLL
jgi:hypothetical protein